MKEFHKKHKPHYIAFTILALVTAVSGYLAFSDFITNTFEKKIQKIEETVRENSLTKNIDASIVLEENLDENTKNSDNKESDQNEFNPLIIEEKTKSDNVDTQNDSSNNVDTQNLVSLQEETGSIDSQVQTIPAQLIIEGAKYNISIPEGSSVYEFMDIISQESDFTFSGKDYGSGMGFFVDEINSKKQDNKEKMYWIYYINGEEAKVGVSTYIIQPNDVIEWKLDVSDF